ncbi:E4 [Human papillomavirus 134]|uniref:E4 n=1 Tax=Human papillomavirus 134 TaxID=909333 RepID=E7BQB1_9PAPI|nr:E4 [Human papillomavirus 134]ADQ85977.1 E4 [Human papillomavirus 134]
MLLDIVTVECGLLSTTIATFLLLLLPVLVGSLSALPTPPSGKAPTPWLHKPEKPPKRGDEGEVEGHPHQHPEGSDGKRRYRRAPTLPASPTLTGKGPRRNLEGDFDEEENKENRPPTDDEDEEESHLTQLLKRWGQDIDDLKDHITRGLENYKKRLGIPRF